MRSIWSRDIKEFLESKLGPPDKNGCRGKFNGKHDRYWQFNYKGQTYWAHRLALCIKTNQPYVPYEKMEVKLQVAHNCPGGDNKWCCTRKHLSWMTIEEHTADQK